MICLVCNHAFNWRIAPLERVCCQCGSLHVLKSGLWQIASKTKSATNLGTTTRTALRANATRVPSMHIVPPLDMPVERKR
jgi:hypothetical protein